MDREFNSTLGFELGVGATFGLGGKVATGPYVSEGHKLGESEGFIDSVIPDEIGWTFSLSSNLPSEGWVPTSVGWGPRGYVGVVVSMESPEELVGTSVEIGGMTPVPPGASVGLYTSVPADGTQPYKANAKAVLGLGFQEHSSTTVLP